MKTPLAVNTSLMSLSIFLIATACESSFSVKSSSTGTVPCQSESVSKNIIGTWNFVSSFTGSHQSRFSGTISFNQDGTILDPDSLLISGINDLPVKQKRYIVKGDTLRLISITKADTTVFRGIAEVKQCNQIIFSSWYYLSPNPPGIRLALTRP